MNAPDMRWDADNVKTVGNGTLIWLTEKALWFRKHNDKWHNAASVCSDEIVKRINDGGNPDLLIPFISECNKEIDVDEAIKRAWTTNFLIVRSRKQQNKGDNDAV